MLACMSAYSSDQDLNVADATGTGVEVDVATNLLDGTVRLSVLWTDEIHLRPGCRIALNATHVALGQLAELQVVLRLPPGWGLVGMR
jgi:hypothetical protein